MSTDQFVHTATWLTLLDLLRWRASSQSERRAYTFLLDGETEEVHITYGELDRRARAIGALLQQHIAPGDRALLLYPPGLDYIAAFFGCMYAAIIAVPVYPPNPARPARTLPRLHDITLDACPAAILTNSSFLSVSAKFAAQDATLATMQWLATDMLPGGARPNGRHLAHPDSSFALVPLATCSAKRRIRERVNSGIEEA
jgi:acyl-CoA synthetase (AMP-forming)/AMP-acid ligase II